MGAIVEFYLRYATTQTLRFVEERWGNGLLVDGEAIATLSAIKAYFSPLRWGFLAGQQRKKGRRIGQRKVEIVELSGQGVTHKKPL